MCSWQQLPRPVENPYSLGAVAARDEVFAELSGVDAL